MKIVFTTGRDAFGIVGKDFKNRSSELPFEDPIAVQCAYEEIRYCDRSVVTKNINILDSYKIFSSKGNGGVGMLTDGKPVNILGKSYVTPPNMACTDSLFPFGCFDNVTEVQNLQRYFGSVTICVGIVIRKPSKFKHFLRLL